MRFSPSGWTNTDALVGAGSERVVGTGECDRPPPQRNADHGLCPFPPPPASFRNGLSRLSSIYLPHVEGAANPEVVAVDHIREDHQASLTQSTPTGRPSEYAWRRRPTRRPAASH